ncbi:hypothetical protein XENTR_v10019616 [Xenopus tropicalis]|uniref:Cytochrome c oxidase subunit n=1 Tax=Xenopus tropicalis TaxID=8364 RepID=Q6DEQ9_XENTR|eukprot:NP_001005102.1 cytochrome c oxidase subunit 6B1 [Xenopus tropicalis]
MEDEIRTKIENFRTAPFDARFPNQNQTKHCYTNYLDYHRCVKAKTAKGQDSFVCDWYKRVYRAMCPLKWVEKWDEQRECGTFPGKI